MRLNHADVIPGRGCPCGVVGLIFPVLPSWAGVRNRVVSRSGLGRPVVEGENPVDENFSASVVSSRVAAGP